MSQIETPGSNGPRIAWLDVARGIGIVLVVLGHVEQGLVSSGIISRAAWHPFDFALYTFHMPLFMFLAGLNVPRSLHEGGNRFLRSKVLGILYPYVLWSMLQGAAMVAFSPFTNHTTGYGEILRILWAPIAPFWFLYALFLFSVATRYIPQRIFLALSIILFPAGELFYRNSFPHRLLHFPLFFAVGMIFGSRWTLPRISPVTIAGGLIVSGVSIAMAWHAGLQNYDSVVMLPAAIAGTIVILGIAQRLGGFAAIAWMGRISLAIYVMHILAAAGTRIVLHRLFHVPILGWLNVAVVTAAGVGIPMCVYLSGERLCVLPWLGLKIGPRGRRWVDTGRLAQRS